MSTHARVFLISLPIVGSSAASQISPLRTALDRHLGLVIETHLREDRAGALLRSMPGHA